MAQFFKPTKNKNSHKNITLATVKIEEHDHHGKGIVLATSPITVVDAGLVGETVQVEVYQHSKKVRKAKVIKVDNPSTTRTEPFCQYFSVCGGCSMQHTDALNGFYIKFKALNDYFSRQLKLAQLPWQSPVLSEIAYDDCKIEDTFGKLIKTALHTRNEHSITGYRRRVRLAVDARNKNNVRVGYRKRHSNDVVNVTHCPIVSEPINKCLEIISSNLECSQFWQFVGHIVITEGCEKTQSAFYLSKKPSKNTIDNILELVKIENQCCLVIFDNKILGFSERIGNELTKYNVLHDAEDDNNNDPVLKKIEQISQAELDDINGLITKIKSHHFLQVNKGVNTQLLHLAKSWMKPEKQDVLYDFYSGAGNFSLFFAPLVKQIFAYEGVQEMVLQARENADLLSVNNCEFACKDLSSRVALTDIEFENEAIVILDPARDGSLELCQFLSQSLAKKVLYVSCNPNSFCRDISHLLDTFTLDKIACLDMFPFTEHLEVIALFQRKN